MIFKTEKLLYSLLHINIYINIYPKEAKVKGKKMKKAETELLITNEILGIVSNLDDADEAIEYARLYIKAEKEAVKIAGEEYEFDEKEVYRLVAETDARFEEVTEE